MATPVVVFTTNNARIIKDHPDMEKILATRDCVIDPDLEAVRGIAPHFWKLVDGKVLPMNEREQKARLAHHEAHGVDNDVSPKQKSVAVDSGKSWMPWYLWAGTAAAAAAAAWYGLHG